MAKKKPKTRDVYLIEWYDIEGDAAWGQGPTVPPLVSQVCFIMKWPSPKQKVPAYRTCTSWAEDLPGGWTIIPEGVVRGKPRKIGVAEMTYRTDEERDCDE